MLEPEYLQRVAEGSGQIASSLHDYIINQIIDRIMLRIGRGEKKLLTSSDKWRIKTLQEAGYLLEDIIAEIEKYTKLQRKEIKASMEEAGIKALKADGAVYEAAGLSMVPLNQSPLLVRLMERNMLATMNEWKNYTRTTAKAAQALYINECDLAYNKVMSGAVSYSQAVQEAVEHIVTNGVYVEYPSGHRDTIETATARAVRTGIAQATGEISLKRMEEIDWDIILVSAHVGARTGDGGQNPSNHYWWQGQYYSRTGRDKRFPNFYESTGYGTGEGLCGWNCRHSFGSGTGDPKDNKYSEILRQDNRRVEELEKKQREMERRIRKTKRVVSGLQEAVEQCQDENARFELQQELDQKSALLKQQGDAYSNFCTENGLKTQNERLQIARANRMSKDSLDEGNREKYQSRAKQWKNVRFKTGEEDAKEYEVEKRKESFFGTPLNITSEWTSGVKQTGSITEILEYAVNGEKYKVDGKHVVLDCSESEKRVAEIIAGVYGKNIKMIPRVNYPQGIQTPDYLIDGERFDLKTFKSSGKNVFYNMIAKKKKQSPNFIFDVTDCPLSEEEMERQIKSLYSSQHTRFIEKIVVMKNGEVVKVYKRK